MASIKEVAQRAGVSIATVSRILNGTAKVDAAKERAVREAIAYYRYEPNQFGRGRVKQSSEMIGVYFYHANHSPLDTTYNLELLKGAQEVLSRKNFSVVLMTEQGGPGDGTGWEPSFYRFVRRKQIDGLILGGLSPYMIQDDNFRQLIESGFPLSYIGKKFRQHGMNVYAQFEQYHVEMLRQLYSLGHRRILLFEGSYHSHYLENILRQAARLYPDAVVETTMAEGMADKARLKDDLRSAVARGVTGVCCPGIREAEHLLSCCAEAGIPVPGRLSVLSVEHRQDEGASFLPPISAMYVPARQMGRQAAEQLVGALQNEETAPQVEFKAVFVPRATVGPARVETV